MPKPQGPKQTPFEHLAVMAPALGAAPRLELLDYLAQGERSVEELAQVSGLSVANTSKHLQQLQSAGLVQARRDGKHVRYGLGDDRVLDLVASDRQMARRAGDGDGGQRPGGPRLFVSTTRRPPMLADPIWVERPDVPRCCSSAA